MPTHPLKRLRKQLSLSVNDLVEITGLSRKTIDTIENGTSEFKTHESVARLLADALKCKVSDLFATYELSHLGRPARTGRPIRVTTTTTTTIEYEVCSNHFIVLPVGVKCDLCG